MGGSDGRSSGQQLPGDCGGGSSIGQQLPGDPTLVDKISLIKKCYGKGELLEALELTRHELETYSSSPSSAILHRLYAKYLRELETDHDDLILFHAKKAVTLFPNSTEYRYFYTSLLYDDVCVPDKKVIKQCNKLALIGGVDRSEELYWRFHMDDGVKVGDVVDGVRDLIIKAKSPAERPKLKC